jgi:archaellum component FlaC
LGKVEKFDIQSIDISEEYATLVSELNTLKIIYDKIVERLKQKRTDIEGAIRLESELTPIAKRIAQIREQLSRYDNLIKMSTITVYLTSFSWKILWRENIRSFMPLILILLILLLVTYIVVLSILRKIKK